MERTELNRYLIVLGCLFVMLICSLSTLVVITIVEKSNSKDIVKVEIPVEVAENNNVEIHISPSKNTPDRNVVDYAIKILEVRRANGDYNFSVESALNLTKKIIRHAGEENISVSDGFLIVHIESDFNINASNEYGAVGLTQVTNPCLKEYNNINNTDYTLEDMKNLDLNLMVGFWYYNRILTHYASYPSYGITVENPKSALRDAYIAYNIGVTEFKNLGVNGRNALRNGYYPVDMYGSKAGEEYRPIKNRYFPFSEKWQMS